MFYKNFIELLTKRQNHGLGQTEAFAADKLNIAEVVLSVCNKIENIVGKGENAGHQHFLLFPQCFPKVSYMIDR